MSSKMTHNPWNGEPLVSLEGGISLSSWRLGVNPWVFNPWTGVRRDITDVISDPVGFLIVQEGEPVMNDWIEWSGGERPVDSHTQVEVRFQGGVEGKSLSHEVRWWYLGSAGDIVAYRVLEATPPKVDASALLNKAADLMAERGKQYDQPQGERSMGRAVAALNIVLGREALTESEGWLLMQILKDVRDRQRTAPHADSLEDCVAYAALKAEARLQEKTK